MRHASLAVCLALLIGPAASQMAPTDPVYWCNVSRSQVSAERDSGLSQIEIYKARVKELDTQVAALTKALEDAKAKASQE